MSALQHEQTCMFVCFFQHTCTTVQMSLHLHRCSGVQGLMPPCSASYLRDADMQDVPGVTEPERCTHKCPAHDVMSSSHEKMAQGTHPIFSPCRLSCAETMFLVSRPPECSAGSAQIMDLKAGSGILQPGRPGTLQRAAGVCTHGSRKPCWYHQIPGELGIPKNSITLQVSLAMPACNSSYPALLDIGCSQSISVGSLDLWCPRHLFTEQSGQQHHLEGPYQGSSVQINMTAPRRSCWCRWDSLRSLAYRCSRASAMRLQQQSLYWRELPTTMPCGGIMQIYRQHLHWAPDPPSPLSTMSLTIPQPDVCRCMQAAGKRCLGILQRWVDLERQWYHVHPTKFEEAASQACDKFWRLLHWRLLHKLKTSSGAYREAELCFTDRRHIMPA